ncbi:radical SAM protein [Garciella nitratireducens]|uniref:radical SAM protein n=1 Tax=Garciella nitratireducens TaxID=218205 RepID=UPI000DE95F20|nr:radical SAM protein [Garciella nitratireducens]RBP35945.1 MoaA/NifB/PqqE/SkfB family radical SAM enzyme [Garciella nitratireducens]
MAFKKIIVQKDLDEYIDSGFDDSSFELPMKFSAPISLIWEITGECHSSCLYCSGGFPRVTNELKLEDKINLAKEISSMKVFMVSISGGEPLIKKDLLEIIPIFLENNVSVMVCTSGFNINYDILKKLLSMKGIAFNISIDSIDEEINDFQRGRKGALKEAIKTVEYIRKHEMSHTFISIESVVTKKNYTCMDNLVSYFSENYSVDEIRIQPMIPMNKKVIDFGLDIDNKQFDYCVSRVNNFIRQNNQKISNDKVDSFVCVRFIDQFKLIENGLKNGRAWGGIITPEGNFSLSVYLPWNLGSIYQDGNFKNTWDNKFSDGWNIVKKYMLEKPIENVYELKKLYI